MTVIAMRKTTVDNLTARRRRVLKWVSSRLELGEPVIYVAGTAHWYVWDDHRIEAMDVAVLGALAANITDIPVNYDPEDKTRAEIKDDVRAFLKARITNPNTLNLANSPNPWQAILDAQGAPAAIRAASAIPDNWKPLVEETE